jgi:ubiquinone/menaquinone biosynthesis C-methylase UbiE
VTIFTAILLGCYPDISVPAKALAEILRVLEPGGLVAIRDRSIETS